MKYKAVIFDFDNTISQTDKGVAELISWSMNQFLDGSKSLSLEEAFDCVKRNVHYDKSLKELCETYDLDYDTVLYVYRSNSRMVSYEQKLGFDNFWFKIKRDYPGFKKVLVTNRMNLLDVRLGDCGLKVSDFDLVVQPADVSEMKPRVIMFEKALNFLESEGVAPSEVISIGDSVVDLEASRATGVDFLVLLNGSSPRNAFEAAMLSSEYMFDDWKSIDNFLFA